MRFIAQPGRLADSPAARQHHRNADGVALEPTQGLELSAQRFSKLLAADPADLAALRRQALEKLRQRHRVPPSCCSVRSGSHRRSPSLLRLMPARSQPETPAS